MLVPRRSRPFAAAVAASLSLGLAVGAMGRDARAGTAGMPAPTCAPLDPFAVKELRDGVKHEYKPSFTGCSLAIDLATCAPSARPNEIVYASGWGHSWGTTLTITSLRREADGFAVTRLLLTRGGSSVAKYGGEQSDSVKVLRGAIVGSKIEDAVAVAEVAHALTLREVPPVTSGLGFGGWFSSSDFFVSVALLAPGMVVDRSFVGYSANDTQLVSLPLSLATQRLDAAIASTSLAPSTFDASARALFVSELARRAPEFDEQFHWWVREAFVRAAGDAGDVSLVPTLRHYLGKTDPVSGERTRIAAISALAALTGNDLRFTKNGAERPVAVVALEYAKLVSGK